MDLVLYCPVENCPGTCESRLDTRECEDSSNLYTELFHTLRLTGEYLLAGPCLAPPPLFICADDGTPQKTWGKREYAPSAVRPYLQLKA